MLAGDAAAVERLQDVGAAQANGAAPGVGAARGAAIRKAASARPVAAGADVATRQNAADLVQWLLQYARALGFYGARYIHLGHPLWGSDRADPRTPLRFLSTAARDRSEDGIRVWLHADPAVARARTDFAPFVWSTHHETDLTATQRLWLDAERSLGIDAGVAVPVQDYRGGPAYISLFGIDEASALALVDKRASQIAFEAARFHALAKQFVPAAEWLEALPKLTGREIECLRHAALGRTVDETGRLLQISGRTVEFHLSNAATKLGVTSKLRAVVVALGSGLLHF
jgi:LuxR family transcriptional regulator, activator of conjugal transfer of Ti plasmids